MRCLPYESRIEKDFDGFIWFNKDNLEQSFNDQASFIGLGMAYLIWKKDGIYHREYGKPAFISYATKIQSWYIDGQFVRKERILDSKAVIAKWQGIEMRCFPYRSEKVKYTDGSYLWRNKDMHGHSFNDQPSYVGLEVGYISWTRNGKRHRDSNKPAFISFDLKFKSWYVNGEFLKKEEY